MGSEVFAPAPMAEHRSALRNGSTTILLTKNKWHWFGTLAVVPNGPIDSLAAPGFREFVRLCQLTVTDVSHQPAWFLAGDPAFLQIDSH